MHCHWLVKAYMERLLRELATKLNLYKASNKLIHKPVKPHSVHYSPNNEFNVCSNDLRNNALACIQCEYCLSQRTCPFYSHQKVLQCNLQETFFSTNRIKKSVHANVFVFNFLPFKILIEYKITSVLMQQNDYSILHKRSRSYVLNPQNQEVFSVQLSTPVEYLC